MSLTGTHASPYGRSFVAVVGSPLSALPNNAVQLFPAWISLMRSRTYADRASTVHLSVGTKVRLSRSEAFVWSLGWIDPVSFESCVDAKYVVRPPPPCADRSRPVVRTLLDHRLVRVERARAVRAGEARELRDREVVAQLLEARREAEVQLRPLIARVATSS